MKSSIRSCRALKAGVSLLFLFTVLGFQPAFAAIEKDTLPHTKFRTVLFEDFCDACGCSASGGGMGFSSMIGQNFVGVRYFNQSYSSRDGIFNNSPWVDENFNTVQIWARIPVFKNFQVSALLPYHSHNRELSLGSQSIKGIGDITVLGMYTLYQTQKDSTAFTHTLQAGAGVKLPAGKYNSENNGSVNPGFQVGTGSLDYLLATEYVIKKGSVGFNAMVNYILKTENEQHYRFGNQLNYSGTLFYLPKGKSLTIVPQAGIAGEQYATNSQYGERLHDTSGRILFGKAGVEAGIGRFSVGLNAMLPISQNLTGGRVEAKHRWAVNLNYSL